MRLRITTGPRTEPRPLLVTGQHLVFELFSPGGPPGDQGLSQHLKLEGVSAVTLHCGARDEPITVILTIKGVDLDLDLPMPLEAEAALTLLGLQR